MAGLDGKIVDQIDWQRAVEIIREDVRSDFILAPHYAVIYSRSSERLIRDTKIALQSGAYAPRLPITINVPKNRLLTRPGSILEPQDRLVYQALVGEAAATLEENMDRERSFSHVPVLSGPSFFESSQESWESFQHAVQKICRQNSVILKTDIANYFETIPQHNLINLMSASGVKSEIVRLLEEQLLSFRQRNSTGIIQGIYPSDLLGNFYLSEFDSDCALNELNSARYVDDIYVGFNDVNTARRALVRIAERLRMNGLALNDQKTAILLARDVLAEEHEVDDLFDEARDEIRDEIEEIHRSGYGFQEDWMDDDEESLEEAVKVNAVLRLLRFEAETEKQREKIDRFCFPILRAAGSSAGVQHALRGLTERPQLARLYASYLTKFSRYDSSIVREIESIVCKDDFVTDYEKMYAIAAIMNAKSVSSKTATQALRWMESPAVEAETRALCAIFAAKNGNATQKARVKKRYESEDSEYVRSAVMYASKYFSAAERRSARLAWGSHSDINSMIAEAIK